MTGRQRAAIAALKRKTKKVKIEQKPPKKTKVRKAPPIIKTPTHLRTAREVVAHKLELFMRRGSITIPYTVEDVLIKFGENPSCYLTQTPIDLRRARDYQLDHIIPYSKGGTADLSNLGLLTRQANLSKGWMTLEELKEFCKKVLINLS